MLRRGLPEWGSCGVLAADGDALDGAVVAGVVRAAAQAGPTVLDLPRSATEVRAVAVDLCELVVLVVRADVVGVAAAHAVAGTPAGVPAGVVVRRGQVSPDDAAACAGPAVARRAAEHAGRAAAGPGAPRSGRAGGGGVGRVGRGGGGRRRSRSGGMSADPVLVERVRRRLLDADSLDGAVAAESDGIVDDVVFAQLRRQVEAELVGAGPLEPLLAQDGVTDVVVNAPDSVWIDRGAGMERTPVRFADEAEVRRLACRLAASAGRRLDDAQPFVDVVLPDGTRLHALLPPLVACTALSLRVLGRRSWDLTGLVGGDEVLAAVLRDMVRRRLSFLVSGGTGSGKTTFLAPCSARWRRDERMVLIEDTPELAVHHPHTVRLVPRPANVEGAGAVPARELVRQALRMRPDRLVVGEFRGAEFVELLVALNTGHRGSGATLHANSAGQVPARLQALGALAGLAPSALTALTVPALDVVVHLERGAADVGWWRSPVWSSTAIG